MNKSYRQSQILKLIRTRSLHTQDELARALRALKIPATQVTLSRDIRELGLVKTPSGYSQVGADAAVAPPGPDVATIARELLRDIRQAQNLLVLKTPPANANALRRRARSRRLAARSPAPSRAMIPCWWWRPT